MISKPLKKTTVVSGDNHEWRPTNFVNFLAELNHLITTINEACLFRGHRRNDWLIDSTLARSIKNQEGVALIERYSDEKLKDTFFQHELARIWLQKLDQLRIHPQIKKYESQGVDVYYEYYRHHQQNPNATKDIPPLGTNFIDFTYNENIGLFFANADRSDRDEGALFIVRQTAIGKALLRTGTATKGVSHNLKKWLTEKPNEPYSDLPLFIHPENQTNNSLDPKPKRQEAVYFAQMDFRFDLGFSWELLYQQTGIQVFVKLILPANTQQEVQEFVNAKGITEDYLFPPTIFN